MESKIINILSNKRNSNLSLREIGKLLGVGIDKFESSLVKLEENGTIFKDKGGKYSLLSNTSLKKGIVKVTKRRGPIVVLQDDEFPIVYNDHDSIYNNDIVIVEINRKNRTAKVVRNLTKRDNDYIGEVVFDKPYNKIIADGFDDIIIKDKKIIPGTRVLVDNDTKKIKQVIGHRDDIDTKSKEVLLENKFKIDFSNEYLEELKEIPSVLTDEMIINEISNGRYDLRDVNLVTIDGIDTKDFDDAVCFENNTLYVAIADVPFYIKEDSVMDKETIERGISVYPPGCVNPMTHHKLSNGICSLEPKEDRLCMALIAKLDNDGNIKSYRISPSVMNSKMRMTYEDVNLFLEDNDLLPEYKKYTEMLDNLYEIAIKMKKKMLNEGFLEFSSMEVKFIMDAYGVNNVKKRHQGKAEELIEFLMLVHNITLTNYFIKHNLPFIARNHERPNDEKITRWNSLLSQRGYRTDKKKEYTSEDIKKSLDTYKTAKEKVVLDDIAIKSQSKARYAGYNEGHFALGLKAYATFSSPIRRLSDYINQRILEDSIAFGNNYARDKWEKRVEILSDNCNDSEKRADKVERIMDDINKARYMKNHIGDKYTGFVSEVGNGYIKVLLPNMVSGKIYISNSNYTLSKDYFSLISNNSDERILVGDLINVTVSKVDTDTGEISFLREDKKYKECCSNGKKEKKGKKKIKSR